MLATMLIGAAPPAGWLSSRFYFDRHLMQYVPAVVLRLLMLYYGICHHLMLAGRQHQLHCGDWQCGNDRRTAASASAAAGDPWVHVQHGVHAYGLLLLSRSMSIQQHDVPHDARAKLAAALAGVAL